MSLLPDIKPRFTGCPPICEEANLPIFKSEVECQKWLDKHSPNTHVIRIAACGDHWHAHTVARSPSGETTGLGRHNKHRK